MAEHGLEPDNSVRHELAIADLRALRLFSYYINTRRDRERGQGGELKQNCLYSEKPFRELVEDGTEKELRRDLVSYSWGCPQDKQSQEIASNFLITMRQRYLVPLDRVEWLLGNERACLFFFLCMVERLAQPNLHKGLSAAREEYQGAIPQDHKARYKFFLKSFDFSESTKDKAGFLSYLEKNYVVAQQRVKPLPWLKPGNDGACQWAWDYLLKTHESKVEALGRAGSDTAGFGHDAVPISLLFWLVPHGEQEQEMAFYAALQTWKCSLAELTLFRTNISKAWRQRQLRRSDKVRPINTHISVESKEKLDALSRSYRLSLQKTLEAIIDKAFPEIKGK